jgi:hypothetical protein
LNQTSTTCIHIPLLDDALGTTMHVVEEWIHSLRRANKTWNIILSSFSNHLNGKTKSRKMGPRGVLIAKEGAKVIKWTLAMQECGLSINLQQLKKKIVELT